MPITMIDRNGPPEGMTCPAVICDACGEPININRQTIYESNTSGMVLWTSEPGRDQHPTMSDFAYVHKGACDRKYSAGRHLLSRELDDFMAQLAHNYAHPFTEEPGVEYVAPAPSTWRLGRYQRQKARLK
jgi:hypothetical protein